MMPRIAIFTLIALAVGAWSQTRPRDPFVFRTVLKENTSATQPCTPENGCMNRLIAVLLHEQMTVLYATQTGTVYLTRNAVPQDGNLTYSHTQFGSRLQWPGGGNGGTNLHRNVAPQSWELREGETPVSSGVVYKGFNLSGDVVTLKHNIIAGETVVNLLETPEYADVGGNPGLRRTIAVDGLSDGQNLRLHLSGEVSPETWTVQSGGTLEGTDPVYLNIPGNGTVIFTGSWQP